jgi:hypothetical protein
MDQQTRMFKTLGCLAIAMLSTSALLGWIDPSQPARASALPRDMAMSLARSAVLEGLVIHGQQWSNIEIAAGPAAQTSGQFLTARSERNDCHFLVDLDGRPSRTQRWIRQDGSPGHSSTVTIRVAHVADGEPMSRAQWYGVRALVTALRDARNAEGKPLPIHLRKEWTAVYGVEPGEALQIEPLDPGAE